MVKIQLSTDMLFFIQRVLKDYRRDIKNLKNHLDKQLYNS